MITVAYYFGGFMILLAYTIFMGLQRESLSLVAQVVVSFLTIVSLWVVSVWLQRRVFLVFGVLGCYSYCCYLAFQVFDGALGFTFALASIGLLIVLTAVGFQKYVQPGLERLFSEYGFSKP